MGSDSEEVLSKYCAGALHFAEFQSDRAERVMSWGCGVPRCSGRRNFSNLGVQGCHCFE